MPSAPGNGDAGQEETSTTRTGTRRRARPGHKKEEGPRMFTVDEHKTLMVHRAIVGLLDDHPRFC